LLFFALWAYSEIQENSDSAEWKEFIHAGGRFTIEDGMALEARIIKLEKCQHDLSQ